jgi:hypothetical protein
VSADINGDGLDDLLVRLNIFRCSGAGTVGADTLCCQVAQYAEGNVQFWLEN